MRDFNQAQQARRDFLLLGLAATGGVAAPELTQATEAPAGTAGQVFTGATNESKNFKVGDVCAWSQHSRTRWHLSGDFKKFFVVANASS